MSAAAAPWRLPSSFTLREYVIFSTVLSVFGLQRLANVGVDIWSCYLIVAPNCLLLLAFGRLVLSRLHLVLLSFMLCCSLVASFLADFPQGPVLVQVIGIAVLSIYHFSVASLEKGLYRRLFDTYCTVSVVVAAEAIVQWFASAAMGDADRLHGIFYEPANFACATLPAICYYILRVVRERRGWTGFFILAASYVLADSSQGFIGLVAVILLFMPRKSLKATLAAIVLMCAAVGGLYFASGNFRLRALGTLNVHLTEDAVREARLQGNRNAQSLETVNSSTLALISNGYVSYRTFLDHPLIGTGLGTHRFDYEKYAPEVLDPRYRMYGLNELDANSLILRLVSETGITGLLLVGYFLVRCSRVQGRDQRLVRDSLIPYFVVELLRHGNYIAPENIFFAILYVFNYLEGGVSPVAEPGSFRVMPRPAEEGI